MQDTEDELIAHGKHEKSEVMRICRQCRNINVLVAGDRLRLTVLFKK